MFCSRLSQASWGTLCSLLWLMLPPATAADPVLSALVQSAKSGDEAARVKAIDEIAAHGPQAAEAVAALTELLSDKSPAVRAHAAHALGSIGDAAKPAAAGLAKMLKEEDATVRRQAVKALAAIRPGPEKMIPLFVESLQDSDPGVRLRVLHAVSEAGPAAVPFLIAALQDDKAAYWACLVLREMGADAKPAIPGLVSRLKDPNAETRREAVLTLGALQDVAKSAVPQIAAALDDEHARVAATFALGQIGEIPAAAEAKVRANAMGNDKFLSTVSYWALARVHPQDKELRRKATELLVERLLDKDAFVRVAAARSLAALPPAPEITTPIFEKALINADEATAHHAMDALATLGAAAVPRLIDVLKHSNLQPQAAYILGEIGSAAAPAAETLGKIASGPNSRAATEAAIALAKIGPDAKAAVPTLAAALAKEGANAHAIVYALGRMGPAAMQAEPAIIEAMKSKERSLAILAAWALTQLHPPSPQIAARAMPILLAGLEDSMPQTRQAAAEALGNLGPMAKDGVAALQKATTDTEPAVRAAAVEALKAIGKK